MPKMNQVRSSLLPVDIVFHPSWWNKHTGITFDEDFFYHPLRRVEDERRMEKELYERFKKSRSDVTLLTVDFNLRTRNALRSPKSPAGTTLRRDNVSS